MDVRVSSVNALKCVLEGDVSRLMDAFTWAETSQGGDYWQERYCEQVPLSEADKKYLQSLLDGAPETDAAQAQSNVPETGGERLTKMDTLITKLRDAHSSLRYRVTKDAKMQTLTAVIIGEHLALISRIADELEELA